MMKMSWRRAIVTNIEGTTFDNGVPAYLIQVIDKYGERSFALPKHALKRRLSKGEKIYIKGGEIGIVQKILDREKNTIYDCYS